MPHIIDLTKHITSAEDLSADDLARLAALSRHVRGELQSLGVDVDTLLANRDRVKARVQTPNQAFSFDEDTQFIPPVGRAVGRASVLNREKTGRTEYAEYLKPEDVAVGWFLKRGLGGKAVMSTMKATVSGRQGEGRVWAFGNLRIGRTKRGKLTADQRALGKEVARKLGAFERLEYRARRTGKVPDFDAVATALYPENDGSHGDDDKAMLAASMERLELAASQHKSRAGRHYLNRRKSSATAWFKRTRQKFAEFKESVMPKLARAATKVGVMAVAASSGHQFTGSEQK